MKMYKGLVTDKETREKVIVTSKYKTKQDFIDDARRNGYSVNRDFVKTEKEFNRIIRETNYYQRD